MTILTLADMDMDMGPAVQVPVTYVPMECVACKNCVMTKGEHLKCSMGIKRKAGSQCLAQEDWDFSCGYLCEKCGRA